MSVIPLLAFDPKTPRRFRIPSGPRFPAFLWWISGACYRAWSLCSITHTFCFAFSIMRCLVLPTLRFILDGLGGASIGNFSGPPLILNGELRRESYHPRNLLLGSQRRSKWPVISQPNVLVPVRLGGPLTGRIKMWPLEGNASFVAEDASDLEDFQLVLHGMPSPFTAWRRGISVLPLERQRLRAGGSSFLVSTRIPGVCRTSLC